MSTKRFAPSKAPAVAPKRQRKMLTIAQKVGLLDMLKEVLKAIGSALAIAFTVTTYHRPLGSFLPDKENQNITS